MPTRTRHPGLTVRYEYRLREDLKRPAEEKPVLREPEPYRYDAVIALVALGALSTVVYVVGRLGWALWHWLERIGIVG